MGTHLGTHVSGHYYKGNHWSNLGCGPVALGYLEAYRVKLPGIVVGGLKSVTMAKKNVQPHNVVCLNKELSLNCWINMRVGLVIHPSLIIREVSRK